MLIIRTLPHKIYKNCEEVFECLWPSICARFDWTPENNISMVNENEKKYILEDDTPVSVGWRVRDGIPISPETEVLEDIRVDKKIEIANSKWEKEQGGIDYNGYRIDTNDRSQGKIMGAITAYNATHKLPVSWKTSDDQWMPINNETDLMNLALAVQTHVEDCFIKQQQLEQLVDNASTIEEVRNISWN